jgi:predicted RNase H-like HicB family nuclease
VADQRADYVVRADWDAEAKVWVAYSDDVPGLATGADTLEGLVEKLKMVVPELLEENGLLAGPFESDDVPSRSVGATDRACVASLDGGQLHAEGKGDLRAGGCRFVRQGRGDHEIWKSPVNGRRFMVDQHIKSRHWANHTLKQAGLPKAL